MASLTHVSWENVKEIEAAYTEVRESNKASEWFILQESEGHQITLHSKGAGVKTFCQSFTGNCVLYGYIRLMSGCCTKFVYVKWIGKNVEKKYSKCNCDHGNHGDCVRRTVIKECDCEQLYVAEVELNETTLKQHKTKYTLLSIFV